MIKKLGISGVVIVALVAVVAVFSFSYTRGIVDQGLGVYFLDVGQGDAIFIQTPQRQQVLIDGGPDNTVIQRLGEVMPFYDRSIDMVLLTHPDADHITGLVEVLKRFRVGVVVQTGVTCETAVCKAWQQAVIDEGAKIIYATAGDEFMLEEGIGFSVLYPFESQKDVVVSKRNNTSIVAKLIMPDGSLLLTGDIEAVVENKLLAGDINVDVDYLKIAHHGSNSSSTESFLQASSPKAAFISVGENNRYGHPHPDVLARLEKLDIPRYTTSELGTIRLNIMPGDGVTDIDSKH